MDKITKSEDEWKKELTPEQYQVLRQKGTEAPFTGIYVDAEDDGTYKCMACGNPLFSSESKFHSGTGWPSYDKPISDDAVVYAEDNAHGMHRTEIMCGRCGSHLGHVFDDGPTETGKRFCVNSCSLDLEKKT